MTSAMWVTLIVGLVLLFASGVWGIRHPRKAGEPFERMRWIVIAVSIVGAGLEVTNFVVSLID